MGGTTFLYMAIAAAVLAIPAAVLVSVALVASGFSGLLRMGFGALRAGVIPQRRYVKDHGIDQLSAVRGITGVALLTTAELMRSGTLPTRLPAPFPDTGLPSWIGILASGTLWAVSSLAAVSLLISLGSLIAYRRQVRYPSPITPENGRARSVLSPFLPLRAPATLAVVSLLTVAYAVVVPPLIPVGGAELPEAQVPEPGTLLLLTVLLIVGALGAVVLVGVLVVGLPLAITFHSRGADGHPALPALWSLALAGLYLAQRGPEWWTTASGALATAGTGTKPDLLASALAGLTGTLIVVAISIWEIARLHVVHGIQPWTPTAVLVPATTAVDPDNTIIAEPRLLAPALLPGNPQKTGAAWFSDYLRRKLWPVQQRIKQ